MQVDELRMRVRELEERERKESKKLADEDALRKIRVAEETIEHLQKKLAATKQVCVFFFSQTSCDMVILYGMLLPSVPSSYFTSSSHISSVHVSAAVCCHQKFTSSIG